MCAPQNFSADLLFKALSAAGITTDYMIRLNDPRVPPTQVSHHGVAVHCVWLPCCCGALHLAPKLLLCIARRRRIVAVHCTLYLRRCCALHLASYPATSLPSDKPLLLVRMYSLAQAVVSVPEQQGQSCRTPSPVSSAGWHMNSMVRSQQALSESTASKPDDTGARRRPTKLLLQ